MSLTQGNISHICSIFLNTYMSKEFGKHICICALELWWVWYLRRRNSMQFLRRHASLELLLILRTNFIRLNFWPLPTMRCPRLFPRLLCSHWKHQGIFYSCLQVCAKILYSCLQSYAKTLCMARQAILPPSRLSILYTHTDVCNTVYLHRHHRW